MVHMFIIKFSTTYTLCMRLHMYFGVYRDENFNRYYFYTYTSLIVFCLQTGKIVLDWLVIWIMDGTFLLPQ